MGCDIHSFIEKKVNGVWEVIEGKNTWHQYLLDKGEDASGEPLTCIEGWIYSGRNYSLFSWLADVRNGMSAWNDDPETGHFIAPLDMSRGVPEDASDQIKEYMNDGDIHSASYFTLKEIIEGAEKNPVIKYKNLVGSSEYARYKETGSPESWCGGSSAYFISNEDMDKYIAGETVTAVKPALSSWGSKRVVKPAITIQVNNKSDEFVQTLLMWETPLLDSIDGFVKNIKEYAETCDNLEDVRLVFGFDN